MALLALILYGAGVHAAKPPGNASRALGVEPPELSMTLADRRISLETGYPLALYRVDSAVAAADPLAMTIEYLSKNGPALGLENPGLADLWHHATRVGDAGTTVRVRQHYRGIPVYDAEVAVTISPQNRVTYVMNGYRRGVRLASTTPAVTWGAARAAALEEVGVVGDLRFERTRLVVHHDRGGSRLAWVVLFMPRLAPEGEWEVLVDAHSGEIFRLADVGFYEQVDGAGKVFDPDPLTTSGAAYGDTGFTDGGDVATAQLNGERVDVTLWDIELFHGLHTLRGPWAEVVDAYQPFNGLFSQPDPTFAFTRQQDAFEAVNTYHHIDTFMRYINVTLGCAIQPYQYLGGVRFDPSGFNGADNSSYSVGSGHLRFGQGGVDDAEDADIVIHELGHGIHDWVTAGGLSQVEGLSEGTGDYLAASYNRSFGFWTPADPEYNWVFHWDGHNEFWSGRITNYFPGYPAGLTGSIHTDGQIWASCNMLIFDAIGRERTDKAFLEGLGMTGVSTNQQDAAQAVLQAAASMAYTPAELAAVESAYQGCGYSVSVPCGLDAFEGDDTSGQASTIGVLAPQSHSICGVGDEDWATFTLPVAAEVVVETSGLSGDTFMNLLDSGLAVIDLDNNSGTGSFSKIDRLCGVDELAGGDYFVQIGEIGGDAEIIDYTLTLTARTCACPDDLVLANDTLAGTIAYRAGLTVHLGSNLDVDGTGIEVVAKNRISIGNGTTIGGDFASRLDPAPCS